MYLIKHVFMFKIIVYIILYGYFLLYTSLPYLHSQLPLLGTITVTDLYIYFTLSFFLLKLRNEKGEAVSLFWGLYNLNSIHCYTSRDQIKTGAQLQPRYLLKK